MKSVSWHEGFACTLIRFVFVCAVTKKKKELSTVLDVFKFMASRVRQVPIVFALQAGLCQQPYADKSRLPDWAKNVIKKTNKSPAVDFSKTYESIKDSNEVLGNYNKTETATLKFAKIELERLA